MKHSRVFLVAVVAVVLGLAFVSVHGSSQTAAVCKDSLTDKANLFGGQPEIKHNVTTHERSLRQIGADVHMVTLTSGTPDSFMRSAARKCPSWYASDGKLKSNLLVFVITTGSPTSNAVYYGHRWNAGFTPSGSYGRIWPISSDASLGNEAFANAFDGALGQTYNQLDPGTPYHGAPSAPMSSEAKALLATGAGTLLAVLLALGGAFALRRRPRVIPARRNQLISK